MLALDTNIIVRYVVADEPRQSAQARRLVDGNDVFVSATVLVEADWVLRSSYRYPRQDAIAALRGFCGLPTVKLDRPELIVQAFNWAAGGMDLADALHLSASGQCSALISFDTDLVKIAKKLGAGEVRAP